MLDEKCGRTSSRSLLPSRSLRLHRSRTRRPFAGRTPSRTASVSLLAPLSPAPEPVPDRVERAAKALALKVWEAAWHSLVVTCSRGLIRSLWRGLWPTPQL